MDQGKIAEKGLRLLFFPLGGYRPSYTSSDPLSAGGLHRSKNKYSLDQHTTFTLFSFGARHHGLAPPCRHPSRHSLRSITFHGPTHFPAYTLRSLRRDNTGVSDSLSLVSNLLLTHQVQRGRWPLVRSNQT